jgi:hypothetical protein
VVVILRRGSDNNSETDQSNQNTSMRTSSTIKIGNQVGAAHNAFELRLLLSCLKARETNSVLEACLLARCETKVVFTFDLMIGS